MRRMLLVVLLLVVVRAARAEVIELRRGFSREVALEPGASQTYELLLQAGQSAEVLLEQQGVDVVVEVRANGVLLEEVDAPTGRSGAERAEVFAAKRSRYRFVVRPYDAREPAGTYRIELPRVRGVAETRKLLQARADARALATAWLRERSAPFASLTTDTGMQPFDRLASRVRVLGLGEATHGSREVGDVRLELTQRLVQRHGYRLIALEASAMSLAALEPYVRGEAPTRAVPENGWIGRRAQRELIEWIRAWNLGHTADRVRVVGVDTQDNALARAELREFLKTAYGEEAMSRWTAVEAELAHADAQAAVFGDSSISAQTRQTLFDLTARMSLDAALLRARYGAAADRAQAAIAALAAFADYNGRAPLARSRDWYMADAVLRALESGGPGARAIFWAHNAHVTTRGTWPTGSILRASLGCNYAAVALTFGEGAFLAQVPDAPDRLEVSTLPPAAPESIENVFAPLAATTPVIATWDCPIDPATLPQWLRTPHPLHWVGALWTPGSAPSAAFRPYDLVHDFDALVYIPRVTAEER